MRFLLWLRDEILRVLPAFIFFAVAFNILNFSEASLLKRAGIPPFSVVYVTLCAAVIAKVLLVVDHLPILNLFPKWPLIYTTLWKMVVYWAINLLVRLAIRFSPFIFQGKTLASKFQAFIDQMDWGLFTTVQIFYLMLFALFVTCRELNQALGRGTIARIFFTYRS
jgi:hypothetical protein